MKKLRSDRFASHLCLFSFAFSLPGAGRRQGFTLVEVMVVLLVVAVLLGYISLTPISDCRRCENEAYRLQKILELVRDEAVLRYRSLTVRIYPDRYLVDIPDDGDVLADLADLGRNLPRGCRLHLDDGADKAEITFLPQGIATPVQMDFSCNDQGVSRIMVNRGGAVGVENQAGS